MHVTRFEPWSLLNHLQRDFDQLAGRAAYGAAIENGNTVADWTPAVDIVEDKDRFVLRADLPGVDRDDIEVSMEDGVLIIAGERRAEERSEFDGIQRFERVSGGVDYLCREVVPLDPELEAEFTAFHRARVAPAAGARVEYTLSAPLHVFLQWLAASTQGNSATALRSSLVASR